MKTRLQLSERLTAGITDSGQGRRFRALWVVSGAALLGAGCFGDGPAAQRSRTVIGDTTLVDNRAPMHSEPAQLQLVQRYGSFDDPGPAMLVHAVSIAAGPCGSVLVYDNDEGIKGFDLEGNFSGWVARHGAGPREVGFTRGLAIGSGGMVAAYDLRNRRVLLVDASGESRVFRSPPGQPRYHEDGLHFSAAGTLRVGVNPPFTRDGRSPTPRLAYLEFSRDGVVQDSIFVPSRIWDRCPLRSEPRFRRGFYEDTREPYEVKAMWTISPTGTFAVGCPDEFEFDVQRLDGSVIRVRWPGGDRVPLGREAQEFLLAAGHPRYPELRPAYARLILPADGRVWVWPNRPLFKEPLPPQVRERTGILDAWRLPITGAFEVFDSTGAWVGTAPLPEELQYSGFPTRNPLVIRGDTIWGITYDSMGVTYVSRYTVRWK